ncbi:MAG: DUF4393 domain-containing protein [Oscillospiraceae bacterium]|jgi:hypothetical protein
MDPQTLIDGAGKALKTIPELYKDGLQPSVQETGKMLARIPKAINAALSGVDIWIAKKEYAVGETKKLLAQKLKNMDPEKIVQPESYVAVPAIQAISYSMDSNELRNMYANLLARSMYVDEKDNVHPAFVEIIKQLSPVDAKVMKAVVERPIRPIINIRREHPDKTKGGITLVRNITWMTFTSAEQISISLDNLQKNGLISIKNDVSYVNKINYSCIKNSPHYLEAKRSYKCQADEVISDQLGSISITDLGKSFYNICIRDI